MRTLETNYAVEAISLAFYSLLMKSRHSVASYTSRILLVKKYYTFY